MLQPITTTQYTHQMFLDNRIRLVTLEITDTAEQEAASIVMNQIEAQGFCFNGGEIQHVQLGDESITLLHATFHKSGGKPKGEITVMGWTAFDDDLHASAFLSQAKAEVQQMKRDGWYATHHWMKPVSFGKTSFPALNVVMRRKAVR